MSACTTMPRCSCARAVSYTPTDARSKHQSSGQPTTKVAPP
jgi:hypothetical protein